MIDGVWQSVWSRIGESYGGARYAALIAASRRFLAALARARPDEATMIDLADAATHWAVQLEAAAVAEPLQPYGQRPDLAGRGQVTSAPLRVLRQGRDDIDATIVFDGFFHGSNGAAHGGAVAFAFDEAAGCLAHLAGRATARTVYLNTTYRAIAPIDTELALTGRIVREEGRKRFMHLELRHGPHLCAEAEVLMVSLRPGQA